MINVKRFASQRSNVARSAIRELLKMSSQNENIISFGGGYPDADTFPRELGEIALQEICQNPKETLQYTITEGMPELRYEIAQWLKRTERLVVNPETEMVITTASQQGLDLIAKAFIDPQDIVLLGLPSYLGAIQSFTMFEATLVGISIQDDGWDMNEFETKIEKILSKDKNTGIIVYVVPDSQNPSGITWSKEKRQRLIDLTNKTQAILIVEDIPYRWLCEDTLPPTIKSLDTEGRVISLITFSKILAPGLRLGFAVGDTHIIDKIVTVKQGSDLCSPTLNQRLAYRYLQNHEAFDKHIQETAKIYCRKKEVMLSTLDKYLGKTEGVSWTKPKGGLFIWMTLPQEVNTEKMFPRALQNKVAYVPGSPFFVNGKGQNTLRLAFSEASEGKIQEGIKRLAKVIKEELALS